MLSLGSCIIRMKRRKNNCNAYNAQGIPAHFVICSPSPGKKVDCNILFSTFLLSNLVFRLFQCPLLNITYCPPSEVDLSGSKNLVKRFRYHFTAYFHMIKALISKSMDFFFLGGSCLQSFGLEKRGYHTNSCESATLHFLIHLPSNMLCPIISTPSFCVN